MAIRCVIARGARASSDDPDAPLEIVAEIKLPRKSRSNLEMSLKMVSNVAKTRLHRHLEGICEILLKSQWRGLGAASRLEIAARACSRSCIKQHGTVAAALAGAGRRSRRMAHSGAKMAMCAPVGLEARRMSVRPGISWRVSVGRASAILSLAAWRPTGNAMTQLRGQ